MQKFKHEAQPPQFPLPGLAQAGDHPEGYKNSLNWLSRTVLSNVVVFQNQCSISMSSISGFSKAGLEIRSLGHVAPFLKQVSKSSFISSLGIDTEARDSDLEDIIPTSYNSELILRPRGLPR